MSTIKQVPLGLVAAAGMLLPAQALAYRPPGPKSSLASALLRDAGFTDWGKIELNEDDDFWEVERAYAFDEANTI